VELHFLVAVMGFLTVVAVLFWVVRNKPTATKNEGE
jgi:hypothetical protein